jgi:hypothetical protein
LKLPAGDQSLVAPTDGGDSTNGPPALPVLVIHASADPQEVLLDGDRVKFRKGKYDKISALIFMLKEQQNNQLARNIAIVKAATPKTPQKGVGKADSTGDTHASDTQENHGKNPTRVHALFKHSPIKDLLESVGRYSYRLNVDMEDSKID